MNKIIFIYIYIFIYLFYVYKYIYMDKEKFLEIFNNIYDKLLKNEDKQKLLNKLNQILIYQQDNLIYRCKYCNVEFKKRNIYQHNNGKKHKDIVDYMSKFKIIKQNNINDEDDDEFLP